MDGLWPSILFLTPKFTEQRDCGDRGEETVSTRYTRGRIWIQRIDWLSTQSNKFSINIDLDYVLL